MYVIYVCSLVVSGRRCVLFNLATFILVDVEREDATNIQSEGEKRGGSSVKETAGGRRPCDGEGGVACMQLLSECK